MNWTKHMGHTVKSQYKKAGNFLQKRLEQATSKRVCLGISGLSQSGKSTFITSLINQLENFDRSDIFNARSDLHDKILSVKQRPLPLSELQPFPYQQAYQRLASDPPVWPKSTDTVSGVLLEITVKNRGLAQSLSDSHTIKLEIRDYPGEWLLDLPLLQTQYLTWCKQCLSLYTAAPRKNQLGPLYDELKNIDPLAEADTSYLESVNQRFKDFLKQCKYNDRPLSLIQPGRFLFSDHSAPAPAMGFIPLLQVQQLESEAAEQSSPTSYYHVCKKQYDQYIALYVKPFFKDFFHHTDRQVVLVDIIGALYAGPDYFDDMQNALTRITECFSYGSQGVLAKLFAPKIDRVVYAASKIDQVMHEDHEDVKALLASVIRKANQFAVSHHVTTYIEAIAAVRATVSAAEQHQQGVLGTTVEGKRIRFTNPSIPRRIPETDEQWQRFVEAKLPHLAPPQGLSLKNSDIINHIRMNTIVERLLEDKLA